MYITKTGELDNAYETDIALHKTKEDAIKYIIDYIIELIEASSNDLGDIYDSYKEIINFIQNKDYDAAIEKCLEDHDHDHIILDYKKIDFYNGSFNLSIDPKILKHATFR